MKKIKFISLILVLSMLTACGPRRAEAEVTTTEEIVAENSGKDNYRDPNEDIPKYEIKEDTATTGEAVEETVGIQEFNGINPDEYDGSPYVIINNDMPYFTEDMLTTENYRDYGTLDSLGRTTRTILVTSREMLPEGDRGEIGHIKPSGWHQTKYEGLVDSEPPYVLNRAHLGMWALIGDESNIQENLISGTRYFNTEGMLPNETIVLNFVKSSDMHILYRVTPYYRGDNLFADGVLMEAMSVEDKGESLHLCRWAFNVQPGVVFDYATGENHAE